MHRFHFSKLSRTITFIFITFYTKNTKTKIHQWLNAKFLEAKHMKVENKKIENWKGVLDKPQTTQMEKGLGRAILPTFLKKTLSVSIMSSQHLHCDVLHLVTPLALAVLPDSSNLDL